MNSKQRKGRLLSNVQQRNNRPQFGASRYQHGSNSYQQHNAQYSSTYGAYATAVATPVLINSNENNGMSSSNGNGNVPIRKGVYANWPFLSVVGTQLGTVVQIQTRNGNIWEGIFRTFSSDFDIVIEIAAKLDVSKKFTVSNSVTEKMIFKACDIVRIVSKNFDFNGAPLLSDSEIAKVNGQTNSATRELEPWVDPDRVNGVDTDVYLEDGSENGWEAEKMFKSNEETYGIKKTFDESLSEYMHPIDCKNMEKFRRDEEFATKLAMEMESNTNSHHNKLNIDNGDEEDMYAAVQRPPTVNNDHNGNGTATHTDKYVLPPRRSAQNNVTNRTNVRNSVNGCTQSNTTTTTITPTIATQSKFDSRIPNNNKNNKYVYNSSNSHYIGNDGHKTVPLRTSSYRHKSNYSPPLAPANKTTVSPPPPLSVQPIHVDNKQQGRSPQRSEPTPLDDNKPLSSSVSTSTSSLLTTTSPPQLKTNTSAQNQSSDTNIDVETKTEQIATPIQNTTASVPKKSRDVHVQDSKKFTNHEMASSKSVENLKNDVTKPVVVNNMSKPVVPHAPHMKPPSDYTVPDILKSSNLNPNAKEFVLKPIVSNVPNQLADHMVSTVAMQQQQQQPQQQQVVVSQPNQQIALLNQQQQTSPPDLSRPQSPMAATVAPMMPIASQPLPHMIALQPHHAQGQPQQAVPFIISSMPHNLYFPQQQMYTTVMAQPQPQPQQNVSGGSHHYRSRGGNKAHHLRDNNMAVVAATGQPLLAPPTHLASYIYPSAGGIQGPCITYRMFPQEASTIPYYNTTTQIPPPQQQTPPNVVSPMQPLPYNTSNGGGSGGNGAGGGNVVSVHTTGTPLAQQQQPQPTAYQNGPQMHHHPTMSPAISGASITQGPPQPQPHPQNYQQLYSFIPPQAGPIMPGTLQYIAPAPGPGLGSATIQPGSNHHTQFSMLIQSSSSTPPIAPGQGPGSGQVPGPGTGSVQ